MSEAMQVTIATALAGAVVAIFWLLLSAKDKTLELYIKQSSEYMEKQESHKKSLKEIAEEAVKMMEDKQDKQSGKTRPKKLAPVVPEHNSPVTKEQQETADLQTLRARLTAVTLAEGLPPRESGPPAVEEGMKNIKDVVKEAIAEVVTPEIKELIVGVKDDIDKLPDKIIDKIKEG